MSIEAEREQLVSPAEEPTIFYTDERQAPSTSRFNSNPNAAYASDAENTVGLKVYKRRWYILFMFVAMNITYNVYWNALAPIQGPLKRIFGWRDTQILLLQSWAAVALILASPIMGWVIENKGLRTSVAMSCAFLVVGKALQALPFMGYTTDTVILNLGQFISLLSGPVSLGAPSFVSSSWFPPNERTTATAIGTQSSYTGLALAYFIGLIFTIAILGVHALPRDAMQRRPYFVTDLQTTTSNKTANARNTSSQDNGRTEGQFKGYIYFQAAIATIIMVVVLIYFPSKPKLPPSRSSSAKRHEFFEGLKRLVTDCSFLLLTAMFGLQFGVVCIWLAILDVILSKFDIDQSTAGWLGCAATLAGSASGVLISRVADRMRRKTKHLLILLLVGGTISQTFFTLTCENIFPFNKTILFVCIILTGFFMIGVYPLFFELVVECTYPVPEAITTGFIMMAGNVILFLFFIVFMFPNMDVRWINWVMAGTITVCVLGVAMYKERYTRLDLDTNSINGDQSKD